MEKSNFEDFNTIGDNKIKFRTNNNIELFHRNLNNLIENLHPKISYLLEKLKIMIVNKYNEYLVIENKIKPNSKNKYNIFHDIYQFILRFSKKYKLNFDINLIIQDENNTIENLESIFDKLLEDIYDISFKNSNIANSNINKFINEKEDDGQCLEQQKENINNSDKNINDVVDE